MFWGYPHDDLEPPLSTMVSTMVDRAGRLSIQELRKSPAPYNDPDEERRDVLSKAADGFDAVKQGATVSSNEKVGGCQGLIVIVYE